jgi:prevent-host-death family protein
VPTTTISSREFNQDTGRAKKAARSGPVIITDRGKPAHVLMSIRDYRRITGRLPKIADLLAMPGGRALKFRTPRIRDLARPADLS